MFRLDTYYNGSNTRTATPWWIMVLLLGVVFILVGVLIFIFPALLAYIVSAFFLIGGMFMLVISFIVRSMTKQQHKRHQTRIPVD